MTASDRSERGELFESIYQRHFGDVSRYVLRRVDLFDSPDVVAQVFAVAWRRFDHIPPPPEDRLWLYGVARRCILDHRRTGARRVRLRQRLAQELRPTTSDNDPLLGRVESAIAQLRPKDREVLRLILWDDLSHEEAAVVLGCSTNAVEHRFRRARQRVRDALTLAHDGEDPIPNQLWRTQP